MTENPPIALFGVLLLVLCASWLAAGVVIWLIVHLWPVVLALVVLVLLAIWGAD